VQRRRGKLPLFHRLEGRGVEHFDGSHHLGANDASVFVDCCRDDHGAGDGDFFTRLGPTGAALKG
jgi:hypothetical protein